MKRAKIILFYLQCFLGFSRHITKFTIHTAIEAEFKTIYSTKGQLLSSRWMWFSGSSQLHQRLPFLLELLSSRSLCKPASGRKAHVTFFSQRFNSLCACRVVGYCSMKLNNNCNCTFPPKDFTHWRYSLNAFTQTFPQPLVHLSRASNNLKLISAYEHLGATWANETDLQACLEIFTDSFVGICFAQFRDLLVQLIQNNTNTVNLIYVCDHS